MLKYFGNLRTACYGGKRYVMNLFCTNCRSNLRAKKEKSREYYDKNTNVPLFAVSEKVLLHDEKVRRCRSSKLSPPYISPYEIISVDVVNITLQLPRNKMLKVHTNRLKPFFG